MGDDPLITSALPQDSPFVWVVEILFCLNLVFSYPLMIYPANTVLESYMYAGWPKSKKRQLSKNITRSIMIIFTIVAGLLMFDSLDKFLSISGALLCTPIAFVLPALFHLKGAAETSCEKFTDKCIIVGGVIVMIFCSAYGAYAWNG
jgi:proton-coupled amino acid transporter